MLVNALRDGQYRTREELKEALERAGLGDVTGVRLAYSVMYLETLLCSSSIWIPTWAAI